MGIGALGLAMAGIKVLTTFNDSHKINAQKKIGIATNNYNTAVKQTGIMENYTGVFQNMLSQLGTQKNILATAKIDKQSTFFNKALQEHEKARIENEYKMGLDMQNLNTQRQFANNQTKLNAIYQQQRVAVDTITGIANSFMMNKQYKTQRQGKVNSLT